MSLQVQQEEKEVGVGWGKAWQPKFTDMLYIRFHSNPYNTGHLLRASHSSRSSLSLPFPYRRWPWGTSLVVLWLTNAGGLDSIPAQATRFHMPQLRVHTPQLKILCATTKTADPACRY